MRRNRRQRMIVWLGLILIFPLTLFAESLPALNEAAPRFETAPQRVVSLTPGVTDMIFAVGAGDRVVGMTLFDADSYNAGDAMLVGGFFAPSIPRIQALNPDVIFVSDLHQGVRDAFKGDSPRLVRLETGSIEAIYQHLALMGRIFDREAPATEILERLQTQIRRIQQKTQTLPAAARKRVIRVMGFDPLTAPGDDSFQNDFIRAAGGIPPTLGRSGPVTEVSPAEWRRFNPEVVYYCGLERSAIREFLNTPEWREVPAVQQDALLAFPCNLTCRASVNAGNFIEWLAARIYPELFADPTRQLEANKTVATLPLRLELDYVTQAQVRHSLIFDFLHKTLVLEFKTPMGLLSTLEGWREGVRYVGNSYSPPPVWGLYHHLGLAPSRDILYQTLGLTKTDASFLFTGADMEHLALAQQIYRDMTVYALATAGVSSNAMRMSQDAGLFYEPGTINLILLSNMRLSPRAMARAVIAATEAKTAVMEDLDVRSSYTGLRHAATGTGTDNVIVIQGTGVSIDQTGGHAKMGELIAAAAYQAIREAVLNQNRLSANRNIFRRLQERGISLYALFDPNQCGCQFNQHQLVATLENLLLEPAYRGFLENAFSLSDAYEKGLATDLTFFEQQCREVRCAIAGSDEQPPELIVRDLPRVLKAALEALAQGAYTLNRKSDF